MSGAAGSGDADDAQSRLASSNSALQSLLRRLGNGMEDFLPHAHGRARMKELLAGLREYSDEGKQMECLTELCEVLSMGQEEILIGFSVDAFLPVLVELLNVEHNPEMMLLSCRAITHLLEVIPKSAPKVASSGAVAIFCERLLTIEFIDVAEQSLMAMHKLSVEHPEPLVRGNGLSAALTFIDFFDLNTQRTAAATAANICRGLSADSFGMVAEMLPNMTQLLSSGDQKIVESACLCFSRLVDAFARSEPLLEQIAAHGMLMQLVRLLRPGDKEGRGFELSTGTYTQVIKTLAMSCRGSQSLAVSLLKEGIVGTVHSIIKKEEDVRLGGSAPMTSVAVQRPMEQLIHTLMLANELLPPLHTDERGGKLVEAIAVNTEMPQDLYGQNRSWTTLREYAAENPTFLAQYADLVYPVLVDISVTIVNDNMRITCLSAVAKLLASMEGERLFQVVQDSQLLGYLAGFIASAKPPVAGLSLMIADMLLEKMPDRLAPRFAREGVVHEVGRLCGKEAVGADAAVDALLEHARHLQQTRFGPSSMAGASAASDKLMEKAAAVAAGLSDSADEAVLVELRELLSGGAESLSSYQVLTSGLGASLLKWLTEPVAGRLHSFVRVFCGVQGVEGAPGGASEPLRVLVSKLNEALSVRETFPVVLSDASGDLTAGLKLLAQPLKLRLTRDPSDSSIGDYGSNVVLIEPLATINAVHDFLWPKVAQAPADAGAAAPESPASRQDSSSSAPQSGMGTVGSESGDEDDDEPSADITRPTPPRAPPSSGREGADRGGGGESASPPSSDSGHSLLFFVNGSPLPYKCPIIQAIGGDSEVAASPSPASSACQLQSCRQAWEQVHTVSYRTVRPEDAEQEQSLSRERSMEPTRAAAARPAGAPVPSGEGALQAALQEELQLREKGVPVETMLTLRLLRALAVINSQWHVLFDSMERHDHGPMVSTGEYINVKLAWKLLRQLQDPLMLCTDSLPPWCADLAASCRFLFPLECREFFTSCTAFGISRALHSMQQRVQGSSASDRPTEVRIGRIQREKITVSRARILPIAMRSLELYASHRSMLEVEYYGEAGTGLGPTLEFFTLVSHELQNAKLGLWRDSNAEGGGGHKAGEEEAGAAVRDSMAPNDGLGQAPAQASYIKGFHEICVLRCTACTTVTFPRCEKHSTLLTRASKEDGAQCHRCREVRRAGESACEHCQQAGCVSEEWWLLSDEEAAYLHAAFPAGQRAIDHMLLQCPVCMSVNFPGTEQSLVLNRGGQMTSLSGRVMHEQDYRAVTKHVTPACSNLPLTKVPVRLSAEESAAVARLVGSTPEAEEGLDDQPALAEQQQFVIAPNGLFPAPLREGKATQSLIYFRFLGRLVGKALLDQRYLDLPLAPAFLKRMIGQDLCFPDLATVDPALYKTLCKMKAIAGGSGGLLDGCAVEDLHLDMTLPGYPDVELVPGGRNVNVGLHNLPQYVDLVTRATLTDGVSQQFGAFKAGFDEVFAMKHLEVFSAEELELHIRGDVDEWDPETVRASIHPDHGFNDGSLPILWLVNFMAGMDRLRRRLFMRFITGSPTLPVGGLRKLNPRLTVVRKEAEAPLSPDDYLPSVMTCANYLKLPAYSSEEVLVEKLTTAMSEGQLSFLLS